MSSEKQDILFNLELTIARVNSEDIITSRIHNDKKTMVIFENSKGQVITLFENITRSLKIILVLFLVYYRYSIKCKPYKKTAGKVKLTLGMEKYNITLAT